MEIRTKLPDIELYSDGGAEPNPGKGGFGVILSYKGRRKEFYQGYELTTNNRMELMGIIFGLERLKTESNVQVFTDSKYVIDGITKGWAEQWKENGWKRKKNSPVINIDLWDRLLNAISKHNVEFNWVKGHSGHRENERCDTLANIGLNSNELIEDVGYKPKETDNNQGPSANELYPKKSKVKVENVGDKCRKCGEAVIKKTPKKKKFKPNQSYYFAYYLFCPSCKTMYMTEDGKREIVHENKINRADRKKTIEILEALASGSSPITGELIENDSVLNERDVIRALQIAIESLKANQPQVFSEVEIEESDIQNAIELFKHEKVRPTSNKLFGFFLGTRKFKNKTIVSNQLYGKYHNQYRKGQLLDFFTQYLFDSNLTNRKNRKNKKNDPYREIDFFQKETFNKLSENAINQLKEKIDQLGIQKTENLSETVQNARINHPRAYESWTDAEKELLRKAIAYTNDLELLSEFFQRSKDSIKSYGQRIIYESQNLQDDGNQIT